MKKIIIMLIFFIALKLFSFELFDERKSIGKFNENDFSPYKVVTTREKRGEVNTEVWQGVLLKDIINNSRIKEYDEIEFLATDKYLVRLSKDQVREYKPMIVTIRNGEKLKNDQYRLIGEEMPDMYWIGKLQSITFLKKTDFTLPERIYPYHTVLDQIRLHYTPVRGYKFTDIFRVLDKNATGLVKLIATDGFEHTLQVAYFKNAYLLIDEDGSFSLYGSDIPSGMWLKNIMFIHLASKSMFFYENIDKEYNIKYKEFVEMVSISDNYVTYPSKRKIKDWDTVDWQAISFVGLLVVER